ncbi:NfeD family protein [Desulfonatronum parangueonense]
MIFDALLSPWLAWFLLGIAFVLLELFLPVFIFLFFGIGCLGVVLALFAFDLDLAQQLVVFLLTTIISLLVFRKWMMRTFRGVTANHQGTDFDDFPQGERVLVLKAICPPQKGRVQHRGTSWDAVADEAVDAGQTVEIVKYADDSRHVFLVRSIKEPSE